MKYGLKKLSYDKQDYSRHKTFGSPVLADLPDNFIVCLPLKIKHQLNSQECTAFTGSEIAEDQLGYEISPDYFYQKEMQLVGSNVPVGVDLRTQQKVAIKTGFLAQKDAPYTLDVQGEYFVANPSNWPNLDDKCVKFGCYFSVDGPYSVFQNIQAALFYHKDKRLTISAGVQWYLEWEQVPGGIVPENYAFQGGLHNCKIFGWKLIDGKKFLMVQNSDGESVGDKGIFYFPESVVNKEFTEGLYCLVKDKPVVTYPIGNWVEVFFSQFLNFIRSWLR